VSLIDFGFHLVLRQAKALGIAVTTDVFKKTLNVLKRRLENWLATKDASRYRGVMHKALLGHPWLSPPRGARIRWEAV
jgi:hypothetical protein